MIFGFAHTNFAKVYTTLKTSLKPSLVQFITTGDSIVRKPCYIVLGVKTLSKDKVRALDNKPGILVVVDSLPALRSIKNIVILDAEEHIDYWQAKTSNFKPLLKALKLSKPPILQLTLEKDLILQKMIENVKNRSLLDKVLIAAKLMEPSDRILLHKEVAQYLTKKISFKSLTKRLESRGVSGRKYKEMMEALQSDIAKRLSLALLEYKTDVNPQDLANKYNVEASEIRFISSHLKEK